MSGKKKYKVELIVETESDNSIDEIHEYFINLDINSDFISLIIIQNVNIKEAN